mgnify:CR=1 FL=1
MCSRGMTASSLSDLLDQGFRPLGASEFFFRDGCVSHDAPALKGFNHAGCVAGCAGYRAVSSTTSGAAGPWSVGFV